MSAYINATQKPAASKSGQSAFLCCFRSENDDDDDVHDTPTAKQNGKVDKKHREESDTDQLTSADSFDERLAEANVLRKTDSVRREAKHIAQQNGFVDSSSEAELEIDPPTPVQNLVAAARDRAESKASSTARAHDAELKLPVETDRRDRAESKATSSTSRERAESKATSSTSRDRAESKATSSTSRDRAESKLSQGESLPERRDSFGFLQTPKMAPSMPVRSRTNSKADTVSLSTVSIASSVRLKVASPPIASARAVDSPRSESLRESAIDTGARAVATTTAAAEMPAAASKATPTASAENEQPVVGRLTLAVTVDERKSLLLVHVLQLSNLNTPEAVPRAAGAPQAHDGDKVEVHVALLPAKQQRRRTSAQPAKAARWDEWLRFEKIRVNKLRDLGLRVRLYLVRSRQTRRASFIGGSSADDILCEAIIPFVDYAIAPNQPFEFTLTLRWKNALAASVADLVTASESARRSVTANVNSQASSPAQGQQRTASLANLNDSDAKRRSSQSSRASASVSDLQNAVGRGSSLLKALRKANRSRSQTSSNKSQSHESKPPADTSGDELECDPTIPEEPVTDNDKKLGSQPALSNSNVSALTTGSASASLSSDRPSAPAIRFGILFEQRLARFTIHVIHLNVGHNKSKVFVHMQLLNKEGKTVADAKTKKYAESAVRGDGLIELDERFTFDFAHNRVTLDNASIMLNIYSKKDSLGWLVLGVNGSSQELSSHWSAMSSSSSSSSPTAAPKPVERWHKLSAQLRT